MNANLLCGALLVAVCGGPGGSMDAGTADKLEPGERDVFDTGGESHNASQQALALADSMFEFDPTLDAAKTPAENATAIQTQATSELNGCGSVMLSGTTVTVSFGPPPGCTLRSGVTASGSASLGVSKQGTTTTVAMTFTSLVVNGTDLAGDLSFATTNATTFNVTGMLTSKGKTTSVTLTVVGTPMTMTIDGSTSVMQAGINTSLTFTAIVYGRGDCYPKGGTLKYQKGTLVETLTFNAQTPTTGIVRVTLGRASFDVQLPAYGSCPPGRDAG